MLRIQCHSLSFPTNASSSSARSDPNPSCRISIFSSKSHRCFLIFSSRSDRARRRGGLHRGQSLLQSCSASFDRGGTGGDGKEDSDRFLQAFLLVSETFRHYNLWKQGFIEKTKWHSPYQRHPFSHHRKDEMSDPNSIGLGILRRFQSPTIFLKFACDGDLLLPIIVGEIAVIQLINALSDEQHEERLDQFHFVKNIVLTCGYEVKMVRITERVVNTYYARIYLGKPAEDANITIDARPSDAITMAERFKAPIYVSKEIVSKDAIKIVYGKWRGNGKTIYDVTLDSAAEGPDLLAEEIDLVRNMNAAVLEERYEDAAMWRDKLAELRMKGNKL